MVSISFGQCTVNTSASTTSIVCGQCVDLFAVGFTGSPVMDNNFNGGNLGPGWSATGGSTVGSPCTPSLDGTDYYWASTAVGTPQLTTAGLDVSCGGIVSFDMVYSAQGGAAPCEGPDLPNEGVSFEYSIDGGLTWVQIGYWDPMGGNDPFLTAWNGYTFTIPAAAIGPNTQFQWIQQNSSGACCDNWGLDNVNISANDCNYYYDWSHIPGSPDGQSGGSVCPTTSTTYDVMYTDGISDTCYSSITIDILLPTIVATASPAILGCGDCTTLEVILSDIPPDSCCFTLVMDDSFGDGWNGGSLTVDIVGGGSLGPFAAVGNGSIATFCLQEGEEFNLTYSSGAWENENTYTLQDPSGGAMFMDGPDPTVGTVYNTIVGCGNPAITWAYQWLGQAITSPNDSITQACPTMSGLYTIEVFDPNNPICSVMDGVDIIMPLGLDTTLYEDVFSCGPINYTYPDGTTQNVINNTTYTSNLLTPGGCDSVIITNITVYPEYNEVELTEVCPNTQYTFPDGTSQNILNDIVYVSNMQTIEGCDSIITTTVNTFINSPFDISFSPNICPSEVISITNNTPGTDCIWEIFNSTNQQQYSGCGLISDIFYNPGLYNVTLNMISPDGCPMDTTINNAFEVYPEPLAAFSWSPNIGSILTSNTILFNNESIGGTIYDWVLGDGSVSNDYNTSNTYNTYGNYEVILYVENDYGCLDTAYGEIIINNELVIYVPNTFTPDGNEFNNVFKATIYGNDPYDFKMLIYNRWGEIVWESYNQEIPWDGKYNGKPIQDGTYVWEIHLTVESETEALPKRFYGHVNVLR
jgi:gliding motility-associated-like protein